MAKPNIEPVLSIVVAVAQNGVIGREQGMPWRLSTDLKRFKATTLGKPVIMGRKTYESIGKPLPGRPNFIISRSKLETEGVIVCVSLEKAILEATKWCSENQADEICIIGGGQIYTEALPLVSKLYVTHVMDSPQGDTYFPEIRDSDWVPVHREAFESGVEDDVETLFVIYEHKVAQ